MRRIAVRRSEEDAPVALKVTVYRRLPVPWRKDVFYYDGNIGVDITSGVLMVSLPDVIVSYNSFGWRRVISEKVYRA